MSAAACFSEIISGISRISASRMLRHTSGDSSGRINLGFGNLMPEEFATIDLFSDIEADERERDLARAVLAVKDKYGKNALVKGLSFTAGATARERNDQVGGHRA